MAFGKYKTNVTGDDVNAATSRACARLVNAVEEAKELQEEWLALIAGMTDPEIEAQLSISSAALTDLKQAYTSLGDIYDAFDGDDTITPPAGTPWFRRFREFN